LWHEGGASERLGGASGWVARGGHGTGVGALLTANRHDEGPDSLETTIRTLNVPSSLPVLTIADPELVLASRDYAERVAIQVLEYLLDLNHFRGVGRLFVP